MTGIDYGHLVAFFGLDRQAQLPAPGEVLHVHLVVAAPAQSVRTGIGIAHRQLPPISAGLPETLSAGNVCGGLHGQAHLDELADHFLACSQSQHVRWVVGIKVLPVFPSVVGQGDELQVVLGEGINPLIVVVALVARLLHPGRTDLERRFDASAAEQFCKAFVAAYHSLGDQHVAFFAGESALGLGLEDGFVLVVDALVDDVHHQPFAMLDFTLVLGLDAGDIHAQHRSAEHAHCHMNELHLDGREYRHHLAEDAEHFIHVVGAVDGGVVVERLGPVEHALGLLEGAFDLALAAVVHRDLIEAGADFIAVQTARHTHCAVVARGDDVVMMAEDQPIELGVVAQQAVRSPVDLAQLGLDARGGNDAGLAETDLDADHLRLEARVADVLGR